MQLTGIGDGGVGEYLASLSVVGMGEAWIAGLRHKGASHQVVVGWCVGKLGFRLELELDCSPL